ncbi:MAG: hypothetical protein F2839_06020 [Actinobacteria bacterium]|uniref:Unannotated protein n=1 Tax=freshwater metagenome TaxID=449393 RepID=A0A6J5ZTW3_9ZZZZ|nr:hypothetical protein [Actinomycetota bacterium]
MNNKKANVVLGVIVGIIGLSAAVVAQVATSPIVDISTSQPEGLVQSYLKANIDRDFDKALSYLDPSAKCAATDFNNAYVPTSFSASLDKVATTSTGATVSISIDTPNGDPFGGTYSESQTFQLKKVGTDWKISGIPWPLYQCGGVSK